MCWRSFSSINALPLMQAMLNTTLNNTVFLDGARTAWTRHSSIIALLYVNREAGTTIAPISIAESSQLLATLVAPPGDDPSYD